jgi:hypothetical protein
MVDQCTGLEEHGWDRPGDFFFFLSDFLNFYLHISNCRTRILGSAIDVTYNAQAIGRNCPKISSLHTKTMTKWCCYG